MESRCSRFWVGWSFHGCIHIQNLNWQDDIGQTTIWPISRWLVQADCAVSASNPPPTPPTPIKALAHWLSGRRGGWPLVRCLLSPNLACQRPKWSKFSFPTTLTLYWLLSREQLDPTFRYTRVRTFLFIHVLSQILHSSGLVHLKPFTFVSTLNRI